MSTQPLPARKAALLRAAYRLFARQGYHGTSMRQIARQAGMSPATIYHYYPDKAALFAAVYEHYHPYRRLAELLDAIPAADLPTFFRDLMQRLADALDRQPEFLHLIFIEWVEFQGRHARARWEGFLPQWRAVLARRGADERLLAQAPALLWAFIGVFGMYYAARRLGLPQLVAPEHLLGLHIQAVLQAAAPAGEGAS